MEFQDVGAHCSVESCNLRDFLPFHCDCCKQTHCLEHRTYASHDCPHQGLKQQMAIKCPLCALTLNLTAAQDPNLIWQLHSSSSECNPARKTKRERCGVKGCKEVMGPSNTHVCGACKKQVCLRHRYKDHHACTGGGGGKQGGGGGRGVASWFGGGGGGGSSSSSSSSSNGKTTTAARAPAAAAGGKGRAGTGAANGTSSSSSSSHARRGSRSSSRQPPDPSNTLQGSADRRRRGRGAGGAYPGQAYHQNNSNNVVDLTNDDASSSSSSSSSTPSSLPPSQAGQTADGGCPFCRALFADPVLLVEHVETVHGEEQGRGEGGGAGCQVG